MKFKTYPSYKDSGVEWLGEVPEGWVLKRFKYLLKINPSKSEVNQFDKDTQVQFLPMELVNVDGTNFANLSLIAAMASNSTTSRK